MNALRRSILVFSLTLLLAVSAALGQTAPPLGTVLPKFGVLAGAGVTGSAGAGTLVTGDVGSSPTATILLFTGSTIPGPSRTDALHVVHYTNDADVQQASGEARTAWNNMGTQGAGAGAIGLGPQLGGLTLGPGVYNIAAAASINPLFGPLTLNDPTGNGIFIFNVGSSLTAEVGSTFAGNANPCNIYWRMGTNGSATLNGDLFWGTVIADQSVTVSSATRLIGRAVGIIGAVTMTAAGGNIIGGCSTAAAPPPPTGAACPSGLITGGAVGIGTVTLAAPAPPGGTIVFLTSSDPTVAKVPVSVVVPAGATSVTFTVTPGFIGTATITATTGGGSTSCTLIVGVGGAGAAGGPTLDSAGLMILLVLLAAAGFFAVNRFTS